MTGLTVYNEIIGIVAGIVTTFLIPWLNKKFHVSVPDTPQAAQEIASMLDQFLKPSAPPPRITPPPVTDLGANPFTSAPDLTNKVTPPENGAK